MKDDEIIKALECCSVQGIECSQCPNKDMGIGCITLTLTNSFNLIKRQKAEIEKLQEYYELYIERERTIKKLEEYIEHLQNKIAKYKKEADRLAWDSSPMGGFHDD